MTLSDVKTVVYPDSDGEPLAETQTHVWVILSLLSMLSQYLGERAVVFANQFFYYIEGNPRARVAPDVMVVFDIPPRMRCNYKLWEEGQIPAVIFEITSASTREYDWGFKRVLYEQIGVQEYWLFDPLGEWIEGQLQGYGLNSEGIYCLMPNRVSQVLNLRLEPQLGRLDLYRLDNDEKLLTPDELAQALTQERQRAVREAERAERFAQYLQSQGINPDEIAND